MIVTNIKYESSGGDHDIKGRVWKPDDEERSRGVVQIAHGMCEHIGRYDAFAKFLVDNNFIVCANDHRGHGDSNNGLYGFMGSKDGYLHMIEDMRKLHLMVKADYENLPYFVLGHSMGSFLSKIYISKYGDQLTGALLSGTGDSFKGIDLALLACKIFRKIFGEKASANIIRDKIKNRNLRLTKLVNVQTGWLTKDKEVLEDFIKDTKSNFAFTYAGYIDLFNMIKISSSEKCLKSFPKDLPILIFSGKNDPIGNMGKAPLEIYEKLRNIGILDVTLKIYEDGLHEMLNETNREEVYLDVLNWLDNVVVNN